MWLVWGFFFFFDERASSVDCKLKVKMHKSALVMMPIVLKNTRKPPTLEILP
jgi:hypothetical protein